MSLFLPTNLYRIPAPNMAGLQTKIDRLARRAQRLGSPEVGMADLGTIENVDPQTGQVTVDHVVVVSGPAPSYNGWSLIAVIDMDHAEPDAPNVVHVAEGDLDPAWATMDERCDHCHVASRRRNKLVVVQHEDGTRKVIGTTCLRDFLGHSSPERIADWAQWLADLEDDLREASEPSYGYERRVETVTFLAFVARSIRADGWVPRSATQFGGVATADAAWDAWLLSSGLRRPISTRGVTEEIPAPPTEAEIAEAAEALAWAQALPLGDNDYLNNLTAVARKESLRGKDIGLAASIISAHAREVEREIKRRLEREATAASTHFGTPGERLVVTATVTAVRYIEGMYGTKALVKGVTDEGNVVVWWSANASNAPEQGDRITGKATVKEHGEFNGTPETTVQRWAWKALVAA